MNADGEILNTARSIVAEYTAGSYIFEESCTDEIGKILVGFGEGRKISFIMGGWEQPWSAKLYDKIKLSVVTNGLAMHGGIIRGAGPNAPLEDVFRIVSMLEEWSPDIVVAVGGGSAIDAAKIATLYWKLKDKFSNINLYEKPGGISELYVKAGKHVPPILAFMTSISSSHIDCFANIYSSKEKRFIRFNDQALRPARAIFDPRWTMSISIERMKEAILEAFSHCTEIYFTYSGEYGEYIEYACLTAIELLLRFAEASLDENDVKARGAIATASDIGGIAMMTGNLSCGHFNSNFISPSSHATLCAVMNPYYAILYANAIGPKLAKFADVLKDCGYTISASPDDSRACSESVAEAMMSFYKKLGCPTKLSEIPGFDESKLPLLIEDAKKAMAKSGFQQIPIELNLINATKYLRLLYQAAFSGDYYLIISP